MWPGCTAPSDDDIVLVPDAALTTGSQTELVHLLTKLGLPADDIDVERLRIQIRRHAWR